jgi:ABC-type Fe3+-hydroxamate transport system substrate-binding protein
MRWVSLLPAATAWIKALNQTRHLIGRSHLDEDDPEVQHLPACTHYTLQAPRESWETFLSPFPIDTGALASLKPDAILTAFQMSTPDVDETAAIQALQKAIGHPVQVFSCHATNWEAYLAQAQKIGQALGKTGLLQKILKDSEKRRETLIQKAAGLRAVSAVVVSLGSAPGLVQVHGGWAASFTPWVKMHLAVPIEPFQSQVIRMEKLIELDPEVVIFSHPEASIAKAGQMLSAWSRQPAVQTLTAYRRKRLYAMDGLKALFWSGPDLIATAEALSEILHTPTYRFNKHLGRLWAPLL